MKFANKVWWWFHQFFGVLEGERHLVCKDVNMFARLQGVGGSNI